MLRLKSRLAVLGMAAVLTVGCDVDVGVREPSTLTIVYQGMKLLMTASQSVPSPVEPDPPGSSGDCCDEAPVCPPPQTPPPPNAR